MKLNKTPRHMILSFKKAYISLDKYNFRIVRGVTSQSYLQSLGTVPSCVA